MVGRYPTVVRKQISTMSMSPTLLRLIVLLISYILTLPSLLAQTTFESVGQGINSAADEQNPIISPDGQRLYFTRRYYPANVGGKQDAGDIWYSERQADGQWSEAKSMGAPLNNAQYNGVIGFIDDGQRMLLQGHYRQDGQKPTTQGVSVSEKTGNGWGVPQALDIPYYYTKSKHRSGTVHRSGDIMVVTLQSYDTRGGEDLYVLFRQGDGRWSEPKNLGPDVNTAYQEMTPFLAPDGKTLFFASNGYEGFGSRDIYASVRLDDTWKRWSNPKNLGSEVNTEGTELSYFIPKEVPSPSGSPEEQYAYFTSTQNSDGLGDIVRIEIPSDQELLVEADTVADIPAVVEVQETAIEETAIKDTAVTETPEPVEVVSQVWVKGKVASQASEKPVAATVAFRSLKQDTTRTFTAQTNATGNFQVQLPADDDYALLINADNFIRVRDNLSVTLDEPDTLVRNYMLTPIEVGSTVNLENVLFDRGTAQILTGSYEALDEVVAFLQENPQVTIEVAGHTDNQGRADLNLALSEERAVAVKQYLVEQGIDPSRITDKGYGGTRPLVSNAIEEERSKNRRVEFTILKK